MSHLAALTHREREIMNAVLGNRASAALRVIAHPPREEGLAALQPGAYDCQVTVLDPDGGRAAF